MINVVRYVSQICVTRSDILHFINDHFLFRLTKKALQSGTLLDAVAASDVLFLTLLSLSSNERQRLSSSSGPQYMAG